MCKDLGCDGQLEAGGPHQLVPANRITSPLELLVELFDETGGLGLELPRVPCILDADEPPGVPDALQELVVLDCHPGSRQQVRCDPVAGPRLGSQPYDLLLQAGDFFDHCFLDVE